MGLKTTDDLVRFSQLIIIGTVLDDGKLSSFHVIGSDAIAQEMEISAYQGDKDAQGNYKINRTELRIINPKNRDNCANCGHVPRWE